MDFGAVSQLLDPDIEAGCNLLATRAVTDYLCENADTFQQQTRLQYVAVEFSKVASVPPGDRKHLPRGLL